MNKYVGLYIACMCVGNKICAMYDEPFGILDDVIFSHAVTAESDFAQSTEKSLFEQSITERLMLLFDLANEARTDLPPKLAGSAYLGSMKAIIHFVVTGEILSETKANTLVSDEKFAEEYTQYLPAHMSLMRSVGCAPQIEFGVEELRSLAHTALNAQSKFTKSDAYNLNVLSLVPAWLVQHEKK